MRPAGVLLQIAVLSLVPCMLSSNKAVHVVSNMTLSLSDDGTRASLYLDFATDDKDGLRGILTRDMRLLYKRSFSKWNCSFFVNTRDQVEHDTMYHVSYCTDGVVTTADGYLMQSLRDVYLSHDWSTHDQHVVTSDAGERVRSLSLDDGAVAGADDDNDEKPVDSSRSLVGKPSIAYGHPVLRTADAANTLRDPMIELAVLVDELFMRYVDNDATVAEITAHQLILGVTAAFQAVNLRLTIKHFRIMNQTLLNCIVNSTSTYSHTLNRMHGCLGWFPQNVNLKHADLDTDLMRGVPDVMLLLTNQRHPITDSFAMGRAFLNQTCTRKGFAVVSLTYRQCHVAPCPRMHLTSDGTIAHEIGHSLGLEHDDETPCGVGCGPSKRRHCIMQSGVWRSAHHSFSQCSLQVLNKRLSDARLKMDCLMQRDLYESKDEVVVPDAHHVIVRRRIVEGELSLVLTSRYLPDLVIPLKPSFELELMDGRLCQYLIHRSNSSRVFASFELCSNSTIGFLHRDADSMVSLNGTLQRLLYHRTAMTASNWTAIGNERLGRESVITIAAGVHYQLSAEDIDDAFKHIVRSVSAADAAFHVIGVRLRLKPTVILFSNSSQYLLMQQAHWFWQRRQPTADVFIVFSRFTSFNVSHQACPSVAFVNLNVTQEMKEQSWSLAVDVVSSGDQV